MAWDVDDVLNDLSAAWASHEGLDWKSARGGSPKEMASSLGIPEDEYLASLDRFRREEYRFLSPNPFIRDWLSQAAGSVRSVAITRTPIRTAGQVSRWVFETYGHLIQGYFVALSPRREDPVNTTYESKADVVRRIVGVVALVDDQPANFSDLPVTCAALEYPRAWNSAGAATDLLADLSALVVRASR